MEAHTKKIANLCRFCAKPAKTKNKRGKEKLLFANEFLSFGVNLEEDVDSVHPRLVCQSCSRSLYRLRSSSPPPELKKVPFVWEPHSEDNENCVCLGRTKDTRGRPKKRKAEQLESGHDSDTDSAAEEEDEQEKESCSVFSEISQNLHLLDKELATSLCKNICFIFGFVFIDPSDMLSSVKAVDRPLMLKLVETIFSVERDHMKGDDEIDRCYKNIGDLLSVTPEKWLSSGNLVLNSAVNGLSDSRTKPVKKVMALDHMYKLFGQT